MRHLLLCRGHLGHGANSNNEGDGRALTDVAGPAGSGRLPGRAAARCHADEADGDRSTVSKAEHLETGARAQDLSLSAAEAAHHPAQSGHRRRHERRDVRALHRNPARSDAQGRGCHHPRQPLKPQELCRGRGPARHRRLVPVPAAALARPRPGLCPFRAESCHWQLSGTPFTPMEMAFAKLKALIRKAAARTYDQLSAAVGQVCDVFSDEECYNYFKAAGYEANLTATRSRILPTWPAKPHGCIPNVCAGAQNRLAAVTARRRDGRRLNTVIRPANVSARITKTMPVTCMFSQRPQSFEIG